MSRVYTDDDKKFLLLSASDHYHYISVVAIFRWTVLTSSTLVFPPNIPDEIIWDKWYRFLQVCCPPVTKLTSPKVWKKVMIPARENDPLASFLLHLLLLDSWRKGACSLYTHTTVLLLFWNMSGTTRVSRYQKGKTNKVKTNLDLLEQEVVSGGGICWAMCNAYSLQPPARSPPVGDTWVHLP